MTIRNMIVATRRIRPDEPTETYVVKDWAFRSGRHVWLQLGRDYCNEVYKVMPEAQTIGKANSDYHEYQGDDAERVANAMRDYCEIRGPAPKGEK